MAVSPADFYAYSRATGVQIPDDPYEKAKLVPEIKEFRQNQLRAPQQEQSKGPDPLSVGLGVGLALAGGIAGGLGIRKLLRGPAKSATAGVRQVNLGDMAGDIATASRFRPRAANESIPTPSKVAQQIGEEEFVAYRPDPKEFVSRPVAEARRQAATSDLLNAAQMRREPYQLALGGEASPTLQSIRSSEFGPNLTQTRERALGLVSAEAPSRPLAAAPDQLTLFEQDTSKGFTPRGYLEKTGAVAPIEDLTSVQQQSLPQVIDQKMNAVESAEDQVTGRMKTQLQRNEDLDMGQVEMLEDRASQQPNFMMEQDEPINRVAAQLPDGLPVDQAESTGRSGSYTLGRTSNADLSQSSAANFLQQRRLKLLEDAEAGTPARLEKKLADAFGPEAWREDPKATRRRNALKLGAAGNEQFFENLNEGTVTIAGEQFPVSSLKEGVYMEDTAQNLLNKGDAYRDWLGNIRLEETRNQIKLANQLDDLLAQDKILQGDTGEVALGTVKKPPFFSSPQERDAYITEERTASRGREVALDLQDEIDGRVNELLRSFGMSEKRLAGAEKATSRNLQRLSVPQKLMSGVEEGIVVRPILTAPDNIPMLEGELSNIERGRPVGEFISQEQLEVVPGGLLSGGRARSVSNIGQDIGFDPETGERIVVPLVDETGERIVQKLAGKRMGADVGVRGRGGVAGLDTKASIGIYGTELGEYGTAAQTKAGEYTQQASQVPSLVNSVPVQKTTGGYFKYPQQREADPAKYTQEATPERIASVLISEQVRKGQLSLPKQDINSYPSSLLARPVRINFPEETIKPSPVQLSLPSDVVPATAAAARVRITPADQAAQQLEAYMGKLQRGRTSPLTSQVRIQPSLF
jgi:hypothetical protein